MPGSAAIGNLAVNLTLETAAFQRGARVAETRVEAMRGKFAAATKSISGLGAALGIGLGVAAITGLARSAFDMAAALDESAQKMGVTVEALQELNLAAEQSGISQESLAGAMAKLNKNMGLLQQGSKPAVEAFAKLGLAADDLKGKSPDQVLGIIADRLNKLPSVQERVAVGAQLMGRGFSELLPLINLGSQGLDNYAQKSKNMGQITTEEAKKLDELSDSWDRLKISAGVATAKIIAMMAEFVTKADAWTNNWYKQRDGFIAAAGQMATSVVNSVTNMVSGIASAITGKLSAIWEGAKAKIESVKAKFREMYDAVVGHSYVPDMIQGIANSMAQLQRVMVDPASTAADKVGAIFSTLRDVIGQAFGSKAGGIIDIIAQFATALAPLIFGGGKPGIITESGATTAGVGGYDFSLPGAASGASGIFGGRPGVDRNVLSMNGSPIMRVSKGEGFRVGNDNMNPNKVVVELRDEMLDARIAQGAGVQIMRTYPSMRADTIRTLKDGNRRRRP